MQCLKYALGHNNGNHFPSKGARSTQMYTNYPFYSTLTLLSFSCSFDELEMNPMSDDNSYKLFAVNIRSGKIYGIMSMIMIKTKRSSDPNNVFNTKLLKGIPI